MDKFCPRCGKTVEKVFGKNNVCTDCFRETEDFVEVPEEVRFVQCSVCGNYRIKNVWKKYESDEKMVYDVLKQFEKEDVEMAVSYQRRGERIFSELIMEVEENGETVRQVKNIVLTPEKKQCKKCSRVHGGYFEAILQLRGKINQNMLGDLMEKAGRRTFKDKSDFVSNVEEIHGGYDIYVSSLKMVRGILEDLKKDFNVEENWSREIVGRSDGEEVYRTVVSARVFE